MIHNIKNWIYRARVLFKRNALEYIVFFSCSCAAIIDAYNFPARKAFTYLNVVLTGAAVAISLREKDESLQIIQLSSVSKLSAKSFIFQYLPLGSMDYCIFKDCETYQYIIPIIIQTSVYKGYKQDKIEMRGDRAEMSDFPLYLNTVAGGFDCRDQTIGGFSFVVKIYAVPVVEIIG